MLFINEVSRMYSEKCFSYNLSLYYDFLFRLLLIQRHKLKITEYLETFEKEVVLAGVWAKICLFRQS